MSEVTDQTLRAVLGLVEPAPPGEDVAPLMEMLRAHRAAFEAVRRLDLESIDLSATFEAAWDRDPPTAPGQQRDG